MSDCAFTPSDVHYESIFISSFQPYFDFNAAKISRMAWFKMESKIMPRIFWYAWNDHWLRWNRRLQAVKRNAIRIAQSPPKLNWKDKYPASPQIISICLFSRAYLLCRNIPCGMKGNFLDQILINSVGKSYDGRDNHPSGNVNRLTHAISYFLSINHRVSLINSIESVAIYSGNFPGKF